MAAKEFAVILPSTNQQGALKIAERIRSAVRKLDIVNFETETETVYITVSSWRCQPDPPV